MTLEEWNNSKRGGRVVCIIEILIYVKANGEYEIKDNSICLTDEDKKQIEILIKKSFDEKKMENYKKLIAEKPWNKWQFGKPVEECIDEMDSYIK